MNDSHNFYLRSSERKDNGRINEGVDSGLSDRKREGKKEEKMDVEKTNAFSRLERREVVNDILTTETHKMMGDDDL